jgi:4-hydroxybenzoate polyprenyltransferase
MHTAYVHEATPSIRARGVAALMRPKHWLKNVFVLAPLAFAVGQNPLAALPAVGLAFVSFCFLSSAVYCFNDALDADRDRANPLKKHRPIPAGIISVPAAMGAAAALAATAITIMASWLPAAVALVGVLYLLNNLFYSTLLKHHAIVDVMSIAIGFVLRLIAGALAIPVLPSSWLIVCGFSLALLLGFGKRRAELMVLSSVPRYRSTLEVYTPAKTDVLLAISASLTLLSYMLYTVAPDTQQLHGTANLVYTVPFVAYGVFRFIFKVHEGRADGPVEILASDRVFALNGILWIVSSALILWIR